MCIYPYLYFSDQGFIPLRTWQKRIWEIISTLAARSLDALPLSKDFLKEGTIGVPCGCVDVNVGKKLERIRFIYETAIRKAVVVFTKSLLQNTDLDIYQNTTSGEA